MRKKMKGLLILLRSDSVSVIKDEDPLGINGPGPESPLFFEKFRNFCSGFGEIYSKRLKISNITTYRIIIYQGNNLWHFWVLKLEAEQPAFCKSIWTQYVEGYKISYTILEFPSTVWILISITLILTEIFIKTILNSVIFCLYNNMIHNSSEFHKHCVWVSFSTGNL